MHDGVHQQALRIDENMPLLAFDLLARIVPMRVVSPPHMGCIQSSSIISALRLLLWRLDPKREPVSSMQPDDRITSHPVELVARTIIPHARGYRARVGGTILFHGVFQPRGLSAVAARPDPAKPSRSASLEWVKSLSHRWRVGVGLSHRSGHAALNTAPSGTTPWVT